jgi:hypothetical protein
MCPLTDSFTFVVNNRGAACQTIVTNQEWAVSLPSQIGHWEACTVQVVSGTVQLERDATLAEVAIESNIPTHGASSETATISGSSPMRRLFEVDLSVDGTENANQSLRAIPRTFQCPRMPAQLRFSRVGVSDAGTLPFASALYVSFELRCTRVESNKM